MRLRSALLVACAACCASNLYAAAKVPLAAFVDRQDHLARAAGPGDEDKIAPVEHARVMREALIKSNRPPESMLAANEGHGFYNPKNVTMFDEKARSVPRPAHRAMNATGV